MEKSNRYLELSRLDCSHGIEVKHGGLKYLKWSVSWHLLMTHYPDATYSYDEPITLPDGTMLVRTSVRVGDTVHSMQLPILDHRNKPLSSPNSFDYNTAAQRCLTKNIAMFGVGIDLYHGDKINITEANNYEKAKSYMDAGDGMGLFEFVQGLSEREQIDLFNDDQIPKGTKTAWKQQHRALIKQASDFIDSVAECIAEATEQKDEVLLQETIAELSSFERTTVWGRLNADQQQFITSTRK